MKLAKTLLAIALPLALSAGCALDVGTSAEELTIDTNEGFGTNLCGQSIARWLGEPDWPVDTIVAGDMEFTKDELVDYMKTNPNDRSALIGEMAAVQLNMAVGLVVPDVVIDGLIAADDLLMAPKDDAGDPPPVAIEDFDALTGFNTEVSRDCLNQATTEAEVTPGIVDLRDDVFEEVPGVRDVREELFSEN